jgi:hypothetical protein
MTTREQVVEMEQILLQAMLTSDVTMLERIISDELIFTDQTGRMLTKMDDTETHRSGLLNIEQLEPSEQVIHTYTDTAVVSVLMKIRGQYANQHFEGSYRYTRVWVKLDDLWKIVAAHSTSVDV